MAKTKGVLALVLLFSSALGLSSVAAAAEGAAEPLRGDAAIDAYGLDVTQFESPILLADDDWDDDDDRYDRDDDERYERDDDWDD